MRVPLFLVVFTLFVTAFPAHAANEFDLSVSPRFFAPYSTIVLTPESSQIPLELARLTTTVGGKEVAITTGTEPIPVTLGGVGEATSISVAAVINGTTYTRKIVLTPQDVSLVVEPSTTVHPLYLGIGSITSESRIRLIALADFRTAGGKRVDPATLSYQWKIGDQVLTAESGIGRSTLSVTSPVRYRDATVSVTIVTPDQSLVGGAQLTIAPTVPLVRIYKNDPLLGPDFSTALFGTVAMTDAEETFRVVPYFFPSVPTLSWTVNSVASGAEKDLTVRPTGNGAGSATIGVTATHSATIQSASQNLPVTFGAAKPLGIFGL